jgi:preprotein translocase subunit SecD
LKAISWKLVVVGAAVLAAIVYILPTIQPSLWPHKKINLGLDLQGGMHLLLEVQSQEAVETTVEQIAQELKGGLREEKIRYKQIERVDGDKISATIRGDKNIDAFDTYLNDEYPDLRSVKRTMTDDTLTQILDLPDGEAERIRTNAVAQALETIRNRIDEFGVSEPDIRTQGEEQILVQLPGIKDVQRAKNLIGKTAQLSFKLVDDSIDAGQARKETLPADRELLYEVHVDPNTRRTVRTPYVVYKRTLLQGSYVTGAKVQFDSQYNEPYVTIDFDRKGGRRFAEITGENVNKRLAIILDDKVQSAPVIQEKISGGAARITGRFSLDEARDLAIVLKAGNLPATVVPLEERTVGPSLGSDSIRMGLMSICIGWILVVLFMAVYYKLSGLVADFALVVNMLLIAAGLAAFQATLTLPGIAGIILTIGMAVDANVLIFERIREELLLGKTARAALEAGYDRATWTILDANITTLIAALVLFQFGTGPVKGFAVTLSLGVVSSVFTSLVLTRAVFDLYLTKRKVKQLSI